MNITDEKAYVIQNGFVGNCMMFWALNDSGYTCHLSNVQTYTLEEAQRKCRPENDEKVWPAIYVKNAATYMIDHQKLDYKLHEQFTPPKPVYKKPRAPNCEGCGRFLNDYEQVTGCGNCGSAP